MNNPYKTNCLFTSMKLNKVVIWGHKLHSHTHSYIHNAFFIAFKHLQYDTYWFDDNDNVEHIDFDNTLFISEHQVDKKIPQNKSSLYFIHFLEREHYKELNNEQLIDIKCAFRDMKREKELNKELLFEPVNENKFEFISKHNGIYTYYMLWGTDLLPHEIDENMKQLENIRKKRTNTIYFVGMITKPWAILHHLCRQMRIPFAQYGASFNINSSNNMSITENMNLTQQSLIAPAFQDELQVKDNYIPCRIFKNISYGRMGITNNKIVNDLFNGRLIYDENIANAAQKALDFENNYDEIKVKELMEYVRNNHTYTSRISTIISFINKNTNHQF